MFWGGAMSRALKPKNNYIDSTGITHKSKKLYDILEVKDLTEEIVYTEFVKYGDIYQISGSINTRNIVGNELNVLFTIPKKYISKLVRFSTGVTNSQIGYGILENSGEFKIMGAGNWYGFSIMWIN